MWQNQLCKQFSPPPDLIMTNIPWLILPSFASLVKWWTRFTLAAWYRCSGVSCRRRRKTLIYHLLLVTSWIQMRLFFFRPCRRSWRVPWRRTIFLLPREWLPGSAALSGHGASCSVWSLQQHPEPQAHDLLRRQEVEIKDTHKDLTKGSHSDSKAKAKPKGPH